MGSLWILNLDAEYEFARPVGYEATTAIKRGVALGLPAAVRAIGGAAEVVDLERIRRGEYRGAEIDAWCVTRSIELACEEGGAHLKNACDSAIVRRVNDRQFCADLGQNLPSSRYVPPGADAVNEVVRHVQSDARNWLLKRAFGVAGRGLRRVRSGELEAHDRQWIRASLDLGGLQVEPVLDVQAEFSLHGFVESTGEVRFGIPCLAEYSSQGRFEGARAATASELKPSERNAFAEAGERVGAALYAAGYRGPFGLDAFQWRCKLGALEFRPLSEINARYTLAWSVGLGESERG